MTDYQNLLLKSYHMAVGRTEAYKLCHQSLEKSLSDNAVYISAKINSSTFEELAKFAEHEAEFAKKRLEAEGIIPI